MRHSVLFGTGGRWREIGWLGHPRRHYYDEQLYTSEGYARKNLEDPSEANLLGPRDNFNNRFRLRAYNLPGQLLHFRGKSESRFLQL